MINCFIPNMVSGVGGEIKFQSSICAERRRVPSSFVPSLLSTLKRRLLFVISSIVPGCVRIWYNSFVTRDKNSNDLQRNEESHMKNMYGAAKASEVTPVSCTAEKELEKLHQAERDELENVQRTEKIVVTKYHNLTILANECSSTLTQKINAPVDVVWGILSLFEQPQSYSNFVKSCSLLEGDGSPGSVRELTLVSGLPIAKSTERLEFLDKESHVCRIRGSLIGKVESLRPNKLKRESKDYLSVMSMHERVIDGQRKTLAIHSYVSEVPEGNTAAETCTLLDTLLRCTLKSLEAKAERAALTKKSNIYTVKSCKF